MEIKDAVFKIGNKFMKDYQGELWEIIKENPHLKSTFPAFLLNPERLIYYFGKNHLAIEYIGNSLRNEYKSGYALEVEFRDYTKHEHFFDEILGFQYDGTSGIRVPLQGPIEGLYSPTNKAFDILKKNGWNFAAQSMALGMNINGFKFSINNFARLINCFFYGTDKNGLLVRNIKWLDVFPLKIEDVDDTNELFKIVLWPNMKNQALLDSKYIYPQPIDFQQEKLMCLNRFVELFSSSSINERDITSFLSQPENQFLLKMAFFAKEIHSEKKCEWQNEEKNPIQPDFFVSMPDGYSDIVEFKLPSIKRDIIVGRDNRESFSAEINSYISQTRVYKEYFEDSQNKKYVENKHGIKVLYPKRWLVIGRRWMFSSDDWKKIEHDYEDFAIRTYDDIVDGIRSQLYS